MSCRLPLVASAPMRRLVSAMLVATLVACGGSDLATDPNRPFGGEYVLQSIDGFHVPITRTSSVGQEILQSVRLSILSDGSWTQLQSWSLVRSDGTTTAIQEQHGTWTHVPSTGAVSMAAAGVVVPVGLASGNTLTLVYPNDGNPSTYIYQR